MRARRQPAPKVRTIEIPVPRVATPESLLISRTGSLKAADRAISQVSAELGPAAEAPRSVLAAVAFARAGGDLAIGASSLGWEEFEAYCAMAAAASGYSVRRNVRLRKPTRQIDVVAESPYLVLAIDCKHWRRGGGPSSLERAAIAQAERTRLLVDKGAGVPGKAYLPVLLTILDSNVRIVGGVPVVPLQGLKDFLASVSRFDERFSFVLPRT